MTRDPPIKEHAAARLEAENLLFARDGRRPVVVTAEAIAAYARKIRLTKILVPAAVFILLLLIVAWPYLRDYESGFTLSFQDLSRSSDQLRMENPRYVGIDSERRRFEISARSALQNQGDTGEVSLDQVRASVKLKDNNEVVLTAPRGSYLPHQALLSLLGGISIVSGTGYEVTLDHAQYNVETAVASSNERVRGRAPFGSFTANAFEANIDGRNLRLKGGVHVRIEPRKYGQVDAPEKGPEKTPVNQRQTEKKGG